MFVGTISCISCRERWPGISSNFFIIAIIIIIVIIISVVINFVLLLIYFFDTCAIRAEASALGRFLTLGYCKLKD